MVKINFEMFILKKSDIPNAKKTMKYGGYINYNFASDLIGGSVTKGDYVTIDKKIYYRVR